MSQKSMTQTRPQRAPKKGKKKKKTSGNQMREQLSLAPVSKQYRIRTTEPKFISCRPGNVRCARTEYIGELVAPVADPLPFNLLSTFVINAGSPETFPWLSNLSENFESYLFHSLKFHFRTEQSTSSVGWVGLAIDYNPSDPPPSTKVQALDYEESVRGPLWQNFTHVSQIKNLNKRKTFFVRHPDTAIVGDANLYDVGNLFMIGGGSDITAGHVIGELWVEYDCELVTPELSGAGSELLQAVLFQDHLTSFLLLTNAGSDQTALVSCRFLSETTYTGNTLVSAISAGVNESSSSPSKLEGNLVRTSYVTTPSSANKGTQAFINILPYSTDISSTFSQGVINLGADGAYFLTVYTGIQSGFDKILSADLTVSPLDDTVTVTELFQVTDTQMVWGFLLIVSGVGLATYSRVRIAHLWQIKTGVVHYTDDFILMQYAAKPSPDDIVPLLSPAFNMKGVLGQRLTAKQESPFLTYSRRRQASKNTELGFRISEQPPIKNSSSSIELDQSTMEELERQLDSLNFETFMLLKSLHIVDGKQGHCPSIIDVERFRMIDFV